MPVMLGLKHQKQIDLCMAGQLNAAAKADCEPCTQLAVTCAPDFPQFLTLQDDMSMRLSSNLSSQ